MSCIYLFLFFESYFLFFFFFFSRSQLPFNSVILWESLFVHFTSILKHKVMSPKEVAAVFVPCLLQSGSTCQEKVCVSFFPCNYKMLNSDHMYFTKDLQITQLFNFQDKYQIVLNYVSLHLWMIFLILVVILRTFWPLYCRSFFYSVNIQNFEFI